MPLSMKCWDEKHDGCKGKTRKNQGWDARPQGSKIIPCDCPCHKQIALIPEAPQ